MLEIIISFFAEVILENILLKFVKWFFNGLQSLGIIIIKVLTLSKKSTKDLKKQYYDAMLPYILGIGFIIGVIYLIVKI